MQATSSIVKVFGLGFWYCPCRWNDQVCHRRVDEMRVNDTLPANLMGHHRYSGSWTPTKHGLYRGQVGHQAGRLPCPTTTCMVQQAA